MDADILTIDSFNELLRDVELNYQEIQKFAKRLVGYNVVFNRGQHQLVYGSIDEWVPYSLRVLFTNRATEIQYEVDLSTIRLCKIKKRVVNQ